MEYKCKICAGSLTIDPQTRIAVCDYCGTKQTLPLFGDDSSKFLYDRGNQYLLHNEYDKAERIFNQLLSVNSNDAEIYWDLVLCKYGVTYTKDPQTGRYIPTCNRTHTDSVFKDANYLRVLDLSVGEKEELYKRDAGIIDNIQKGILEVSRKEKPFDIFISYKETDENGNRTKDSIEAQKLYEKLTDIGYKVFFSRITLESKIGEEFEPYIYAALSSSKIMITVCSSIENINAAWVKNEWSRFLSFRRGSASKTLIPVYFDMEESKLPEEFSLLSAQDLRAEDFEQELIRGIKKLIPISTEQIAYRKKRNKIILLVSTVAVIAILFVAAEMNGWVGKKAHNKKQYAKAAELYAAGNYGEAKLIFDDLGDYEDASELAVKCIYQTDYEAALELYYNRKYAEATWALAAIGDYDEVNETLKKCEKAWRNSLSNVALTSTKVYPIEGSYYIDENGSVKSFSTDPGVANVVIKTNDKGEVTGTDPMELNEHGKIISIADNSSLYALYEDGHVCNSANLNRMDSDWENVIQISDEFNVTNVALLSDGTVVYGDTTGEEDGYSDEWLQDVSGWKNIIKLDWYCDSRIFVEDAAILVGVDKDGKVHSAKFEHQGQTEGDATPYEQMTAFLDGLNNIKDVTISEKYVSALDYDNALHIFCIESKEVSEKTEVKSLWGEYYIDSKNNLKKYTSDNVILEGVVFLNNGYCVLQNGTIHTVDGKSTYEKTKVKDAWLER